MSEYLKTNVIDVPYFVTLTTVGWIDVFTREAYSKELIKNWFIHDLGDYKN
jgi:putative transposase